MGPSILVSNFLTVPLNIKKLAHNAKRFQAALSTFLHSKSFYTVEEYLNHE